MMGVVLRNSICKSMTSFGKNLNKSAKKLPRARFFFNDPPSEGSEPRKMGFWMNFSDARLEVSDARMELSNTCMEVSDTRMEVCNARMEVPDARPEVCNARMEVPDTRMEVSDARMELSNTCTEVPDARMEVPDARRKASYICEIEAVGKWIGKNGGFLVSKRSI
jgi:hypothetical protein